MSLNHLTATTAFSSATSLGGRLEDSKLGKLTVQSGLNLPTSAVKTANYTVTANDYLILVNTTGGALTMTLPAAAAVPPPSNGFVCTVVDASGTAASNNITVAAGAGSTLVGPTGTGTISVNRTCQRYIYYSTVYYAI